MMLTLCPSRAVLDGSRAHSHTTATAQQPLVQTDTRATPVGCPHDRAVNRGESGRVIAFAFGVV